MKKKLLSWDVWAYWDEGVNILLPKGIKPTSDVAIQKVLEAFREKGLDFDQDVICFEFKRDKEGDTVTRHSGSEPKSGKDKK